jgi:DMSO reductase family type II enzyme heme b subunit
VKIAKLAGKLADPASAEWGSVDPVQIPLSPVALEVQPTEYIRETWKDRDYGQTAEAAVKAASDGDRLYIRVEWADDPKPNHEFQDAVSAIFPTNGSGVLATLGNDDKPLALWFWENGRPGPLNLIASGPGVFRKEDGAGLAASGVLADGRWSVVLSGPAAISAKGKVALAVWNGSNDERAGLAAVSREWLPLETD